MVQGRTISRPWAVKQSSEASAALTAMAVSAFAIVVPSES
jgi:hypothetical protein